LLAERPMIASELGRALIARGIGDDVEAMGNSARVHVPLVQLPPRGVWGGGGKALYAPLEAWTGESLDPSPSVDDVVLRYLRAFGPASAMDAQKWCGLTKLTEVFERLRPQLVSFRDEDGRELFDLPDAPRPGPDVEAPVRFLGEYDNVLLSHVNRRRVIPDGFSSEAMLGYGRFVENLLVDGMLRATWWIDREGKKAVLGIRPFGTFSADERDAVEAEAQRMLEFAAGDAQTREVRFADPVA
jgi:hypothetical protein